jgi:hypothetical protein
MLHGSGICRNCCRCPLVVELVLTSIYVPADVAPKIEEALENGRRLQQLINDAGVRYVEAVKRQRAGPSRRGS